MVLIICINQHLGPKYLPRFFANLYKILINFMMNLRIYFQILTFSSPLFKEIFILCHLKIKNALFFDDLKFKSTLWPVPD